MNSERFVDYYELLGVDKLSSVETIREKCIELGERFRPENDPSGGSQNLHKFALIEQAYATLCDPQTREAYDRAYTDYYIQQLADNSTSRFSPFKLGWWKQPWVILTCFAVVTATAFGINRYFDYLDAQEAETMRWIQQGRDSIAEQKRKHEEFQEQLKEADRRGERRAEKLEAEWRHLELMNEQKKTREELERLRSEVEFRK